MALSFGSDFDEHAADMLVSLVCYSHSAAKRLFGPLLRKRAAENIHVIVSAARTHLNSGLGFNFDKQIPATQNLHYLAGMIHFAKLRLACSPGTTYEQKDAEPDN